MSRFRGAWLPLVLALAACEPTLAELPGRPTTGVAIAGAPGDPAPSGTAVAPAIIFSSPFIGSVPPSPVASGAPGASAVPAGPGPSGSLGPPRGYPNAVRLRGRLFDEGGKPIDGARVRVRALQFDLWYDTTVATGRDGAYAIEDVPTGVNMEITASKEGFTERRRVAALPPRPDWHTIEFGAAPGLPTDPDETPGAPYYLSNRPEIVLISPDAEGTLPSGREVAFVLEVSEPLDEDNEARLAAALRLLPASAAAVPAGTSGQAPDLRDARRDDVDLDPAAGDVAWAIRPGTRFPEGTGPAAEATWSGRTRIRFRVPAVLVASGASEVRYQLALAAPPDGERIEDAFFHQLGTDADGDVNGYPAPGRLLHHVFREEDLQEAWEDREVGDAPRDRWAAIHRDAARVVMARDDHPPALAAIDAGRAGSDAAITLAFDEPMVAFDGTAAGHRGPGLAASAGGALAFTFALGETEADLAGVALDGALDGEDALIDARTITYLGSEHVGRELAFLAETAVGTRENAPPGSVVVEPDPADPRRLRLLVVGRPFFFKGAGAIKVRVAGFGDPAGNVRSAAQADAEVRVHVLPTPTPAPAS